MGQPHTSPHQLKTANAGAPEWPKAGGTSAWVPQIAQGAPMLISRRLFLVFGERVLEKGENNK